MGRDIVFVRPDGDYTVTLPDGPPYEDKTLVVRDILGINTWSIETETAEPDGMLKLAGMTGQKPGLWFELRLSQVPEMLFWGDRVLVRKDTAR